MFSNGALFAILSILTVEVFAGMEELSAFDLISFAITWDDFSRDNNKVLHIEKGQMVMDENAFSENVLELEKVIFE